MLSSPSSAIGTRRTELEKEGRLSLSKLGRVASKDGGRAVSPDVRRGEARSMLEREEVRRGGGGLGGPGVATAGVLGIDVDDRFEEALFRAGGAGGGDLRLAARCTVTSSAAAAVVAEVCGVLRRAGGGGGGAPRVEDVVLSAMLSLSSVRDGRIEDVPLVRRTGAAAIAIVMDARWEDLRANGGGGGFLGCGACSVASKLTLGVSSRGSSNMGGVGSARGAGASAGRGGRGRLNSDDDRVGLSSTDISCSGPAEEKSSKETIRGPALVTDLPCL